ncbi:S-layer homology domain-containing protein [Paenibacillus sp. GP183]|uniref:S-layer homology domain-containing protein n=1 Tax=Paenibacillus sp. GP183 TaxID=1882751 RepID=UPI00089C61B4|nr:S-layer homology domain-containing protein [Paenibacillus sp. GP183]SEB40030.1 S-layer homology domain-containing protein [Paenibacillus sp. GP183]
MFKKAAALCLAFIMILGSSTAVLAKDNGNKNDDNKDKGRKDDDHEIEIHLNFDDLKNAEWAARYIASLASKRVFEGYEDGTFKPDNTVSRIEAITAAVRLMGLRSQAESPAKMSTHLNFKDAAKVPAWAVGYVAVALENDLFSVTDDYVQPQRDADRLWAATLLVKALKLDAQAKTKMNTTLPFKDANQIPAGSVGYIAVAYEKGLIDGFEDNTFRPNQLVTRAQLAALLDRTGGQIPNQGENTITGTVFAAVINNNLKITRLGTTTEYTLHPDVFIFRNGAKVSAAALQAGDEVNVRIYNNQIVFIEVTKPVQAFITIGTISSNIYNNTLTLTKSGVTSTFTLHPDIIVYRNGVKATTADLKVGDEVSIRFSDNKVIFIEVTNPVQVIINSGIISSNIYNNSLTLTISGVTSTFTLHPDIIVYRNGVKAAIADLKVGDEVSIRFSDNKVIYIEVTKMVVPVQTLDIFGILKATTVDARGVLATISIAQTINGIEQTTIYNVSSNVTLSGNLALFVQGHLIQLKGMNWLVASITIL